MDNDIEYWVTDWLSLNELVIIRLEFGLRQTYQLCHGHAQELFNVEIQTIKSKEYLLSPVKATVCHLIFVVIYNGNYIWRIYDFVLANYRVEASYTEIENI